MKENRGTLIASMLAKFGSGFLIIGILLFAGAGTVQYANGWLLILSLFLPILGFGVFLLRKHPEVLKRRLQSREAESQQVAYVIAFGLIYMLCYGIAGLDFRWKWSDMPMGVSIVATIVMLVGYTLFCRVILENAYASRVVAVEENQTVVSTGLYARVRHPMYLASLLVFLPMPFILGSYYAAIPMAGYPLVLALRILNEEKVLTAELHGYADYVKSVKYRLIPYIW